MQVALCLGNLVELDALAFRLNRELCTYANLVFEIRSRAINFL